MSSYTPSPELRQLIDRLLEEGALSRTEMARIEELCDDPRALAYYIAVTTQEGMLPEAVAHPVKKSPRQRRLIPFTLPVRELLKIAAACIIAFAIGWIVRPTPKVASVTPPKSPDYVATITDVDEAGEKAGLRIGQGLEKGVIAVPDQSKVGIAMHSGARLEIRGPATFDIENAEKLRMRKGRISSYVPVYARGFTVDTDDGRIVDLGTRFVTATGAGLGTEIHVVEGLVEAYGPRPGSRPWSLATEKAGILKDGKMTPTDYLKQRLDIPLNPILPDQDDDGIADVVETFYGTDPQSALSRPAPLRIEETFDGYPPGSVVNISSRARGVDQGTLWMGNGSFITQGLAYRNGKALRTSGGALRTTGKMLEGAIFTPSWNELPQSGAFYLSFLTQQTSTKHLKDCFGGFLLYGDEREELFIGKLSARDTYGSRFKRFSLGEAFGVPLNEATHLFVVRIDRTRLVTDIFIDPVLGVPETAAQRKVRYYDVPDFNRVSLRSGGTSAIASGDNRFPNVFDEIRIGLTWDSVLPTSD